MKTNYRGYTIDVKSHVDGNIQVSLNDVVQCHQTSIAAAMKWIDRDFRNKADDPAQI